MVRGFGQYPDQHHTAALALWTLPQRTAGELFVTVAVVLLGRRRGVRAGRLHAEQAAALVEFLLPIAISQEAIVANALESVRQDMEQETPDEFIGGQGHGFAPPAISIVLTLE